MGKCRKENGILIIQPVGVKYLTHQFINYCVLHYGDSIPIIISRYFWFV